MKTFTGFRLNQLKSWWEHQVEEITAVLHLIFPHIEKMAVGIPPCTYTYPSVHVRVHMNASRTTHE